MKTVVIEKPVRHLMGLIERLQAHEPKLRLVNVGVDKQRTYVYLADDEMQDPTQIVADWTDPAEIRLVPMNEEGPDGTPEAKAGGDEAHVVLIEKIDSLTGQVTKGSEELTVLYHGVAAGSMRVTLENGVASVQIGPVNTPGDIFLHVSDHGAELGQAEVRLRFVGEQPPPPPPPQEPQPESAVPVSSEMLVPEASDPIGSGGADQAPELPKKKWWSRIFGR